MQVIPLPTPAILDGLYQEHEIGALLDIYTDEELLDLAIAVTNTIDRETRFRVNRQQ